MIVKFKSDKSVLTDTRATKRLRSPVFTMKEFKDSPMVSFCITHKNRFSQISETLPTNLEANKIDQDRIEFVVVDFGSAPDISEWIIENFKEELSSGYLKFFRTNELRKWHAPLAKNTSHRLSSGKIVVNLDGDNFTGYRGGAMVANHFMSQPFDICLWQFSGQFNDGSYGRIAASRDAFMSLGGYNEDLLEMGLQDRDLVTRLERLGARVVLDPDDRYNKAIQNEKYDPDEMDYIDMRNANKFLASRLKKQHSRLALNCSLGLGGVERLVFVKHKCEFQNVV